MITDKELAQMEAEADALVFQILLKRARTIVAEMECQPDAKLSPTDLAALKELRRVSAESRENRRAREESASEEAAIQPPTHEHSKSVVRESVSDSMENFQRTSLRPPSSIPKSIKSKPPACAGG